MEITSDLLLDFLETKHFLCTNWGKLFNLAQKEMELHHKLSGNKLCLFIDNDLLMVTNTPTQHFEIFHSYTFEIILIYNFTSIWISKYSCIINFLPCIDLFQQVLVFCMQRQLFWWMGFHWCMTIGIPVQIFDEIPHHDHFVLIFIATGSSHLCMSLNIYVLLENVYVQKVYTCFKTIKINRCLTVSSCLWTSLKLIWLSSMSIV